MDNQILSIVVGGEGINQFCLMDAMKKNLIPDAFLISGKLVLGKAPVGSVFGNPEMFKIDFLVSLLKKKIGSIRLVRPSDAIRINRLVFIFDSINIEEIGNLAFLDRTDIFRLNSDFLFGQAFLEGIQIVLPCRKIVIG